MTSGQEYSAMPPKSHSEEAASTAESAAVSDESVRKRLAIGLTPQRATAPAAPQRPPQPTEQGQRQAWTLVGLVFAVMFVTVALVWARMVDAPTAWPGVVRSLVAGPARLFSAPAGEPAASAVFAANMEGDRSVDGSGLDGESLMAVDFGQSASTLGSGAYPEAFIVGPEVEEGVYRMSLWPEHVAWAIVGPGCAAAHWIEAEGIVDTSAPSGQIALIGRFHDDANLALFGIDGGQEYEVLILRDGAWTQAQTPRYDEAINPAGVANRLALYDDGRTVQFAVNDKLLYQSAELGMPMGLAGLAGRAAQEPAQIDFARFQMASAPCRKSLP